MNVAVYDVSTIITKTEKKISNDQHRSTSIDSCHKAVKSQEKPKRPFWPVFGLWGSKKGQKRVFGQKETAVVSGFFDVFAFFGKP